MTYNFGQNICKLFHFLAEFALSASETELDYQQRVNVRVPSRTAEQFQFEDLRKLGNFTKISQMLGFDGEYPAVHASTKF